MDSKLFSHYGEQIHFGNNPNYNIYWSGVNGATTQLGVLAVTHPTSYGFAKKPFFTA